MTRTVADAAILLNAIAFADADDSSMKGVTRARVDYTQFLDANGLRGSRIGVARDYWGRNAAVDKVMNAALESLKRAGAVLVDVRPAGAQASLPAGTRVDTLARGLAHPWGIALVPDGRKITTAPSIASVPRFLIGLLAGRSAGAATGVLGTLVWSLFNPTVLPFAAGAAIVGLLAGTAAPLVLRRTWTEGGRRYFHYSSDVPIGGQFMFFSADYDVHREQRNGVEIQVFNDPRHTHNRDHVLRSVRASLDYFSAQFGDYPYPFLQIIEQPAKGMGMGVDGSGVVTGLEGFFRLDPEGDEFDAIFQIVAHEMAHQWWGVQLKYAYAEGAIVLSESLAWYSAMGVVEHARGPEELERLVAYMRENGPLPE